MSDSEILDFDQWGGLKSDGIYNKKIPNSDGVHRIYWEGSEIIYRISNSKRLAESDNLLIGLNAAISNRSSKVGPFFTGGGKATSIDAPILSISDPGTHIADVSLAWYLGTDRDRDFQRNLSSFIKRFSEENLCNPILFGGSGGGFASIVISKLMNLPSKVLAMNPQTSVMDWYDNPLRNLFTKVWNCNDKEKFREKLLELDIIFEFNSDNNKEYTDILVLQNLFDEYHMENHFPRISDVKLANLNPEGKVGNFRWFIGCWGLGHYAPWPEHVKSSLSIMNDSLPLQEVIKELSREFYPVINKDNLNVNLEEISLSGGAALGDFKSMIRYRARSDLNYERIPVEGYEFSRYDSKDRNLAFNLQSLRQIDTLLKSESEKLSFKFYISLFHTLDWIKYSKMERDKLGMLWYDMSSGLRAQKLAFMISLTYSVKSLERYRPNLIESAKSHIQWFNKPGFVKNGNHGIFQIHGHMALVKALSKSDVEEDVIKKMKTIFSSQFSKELMHVENSPEYHQFVISIFSAYFRTGWYGESVAKQLSEAEVLNYWLLDTHDQYICVGDTEPKKLHLHDKVVQNAISNSDLTFTSSNQIFDVKAFESTGYLTCKSRDSGGDLLFSLSAFVNIGHRQADDLSFVLYDSGYWRFVDPGKYTYQRDLRKYIDKTWQHNSLVINGNSYSVSSDSMYESCRENYTFDDVKGVFETTLSKDLGNQIKHERKIFYSPRRFIVIQDVVSSNTLNNIAQWFQVGPEYEKYDIENNSVSFENPKSYFEIEFFSSRESNVIVHKGNHELPVGWYSQKYKDISAINSICHSSDSNNVVLTMIAKFSEGEITSEIFELLEIELAGF